MAENNNQKQSNEDIEKICHKCGKKIGDREPYTFKDKEYCCEKCCHSEDDNKSEGCEFC